MTSRMSSKFRQGDLLALPSVDTQTRWTTEYSGLSLTNFLEVLDRENWFWAVKRLSGNDTGANGTHQCGLYVPRWFCEHIFPAICTTTEFSPRESFQAYVVQEDIVADKANAIYYNSKFFPQRSLKKKYNEFRLTKWGGKSNPVQNHDSTGAIVVIAGKKAENGSKRVLVWVCSNAEQESIVESWVGAEVIPSEFYGRGRAKVEIPERVLSEAKKLILPSWRVNFPTGKEIFKKVVEANPKASWTDTLDTLLLRRRKLEFAIFQLIEEAHVLPLIKPGFSRVDSFLTLALNVANRRKSRTGKSLELNLAEIFTGLLEFEVQKKTEGNKKPDFLFPSQIAYKTASFPRSNLHMLAAKTCCKDRWRQILSEAHEIWPKHLFTLQEGVSKNQLDEMVKSRVCLVVPEPNIKSFPKEYRDKLLTLEGFIALIRSNQRQPTFVRK